MYRPRATRDLVVRTRVTRQLECQDNRSVTLVCAPAGFGKTTLLAQWLDGCPNPVAWLSLDSADSDLGIFLSYLTASIRLVFPDACPETLALLGAPVLPPPATLASALAGDLLRLADDPTFPAGLRLVVVLDDYHLIRDPDVHELMGELLRRAPLATHFVLTARHDPPLSLAELRAHEKLNEVRARDLRFTPEEVAAFMEQVAGATLRPEALAMLVERTEGWPTGVRLAALSVNAGIDVVGQKDFWPGNDRYALDYLLTEVLAQVPYATRVFLIETSILDRLTGSLCDAVSPPISPEWDGQAYLEYLAANNLFTFALEGEQNWHRYHHLFQRLLRSQLEQARTPGEIAELHRRASRWFGEREMIDEAVQHALAAGDELAAIDLIEAHRHRAMNEENSRQLERWQAMMPRSLIEARPELLLMEAWAFQRQWRIFDLPFQLDRVDALMERAAMGEAQRVRLRAEIDTLRALTCYNSLDAERARAFARRALDTAPSECSYARGTAWLYYGGALQMLGDEEGALRALRQGIEEDRLHGNAFATLPYVGLCLIRWVSGEVGQLLATATEMLRLAEQRKLIEATAWARYLRGTALYSLNDLEGAEREFDAVFRQRYLAHGFPFSQSGFGLATIAQLKGDHQRAREIGESVTAYGLETGNRRILTDGETFLAWLALQRGATAEAESRASVAASGLSNTPLNTFHLAPLSQARILAGARTATGQARAAEVLERLRQVATATRNTRVLIETLALQALLLSRSGEGRAAMVALTQAVELAEPGGALRIFVDLGPEMANMLRKLSWRGVAPAYLARLLAAFGEDQPTRGAEVEAEDDLIEPLTTREMEVLALLAQRLTNKEIAVELDIAPMTVKRHTINIYEKLGVDSRRSAVTEAESLGLLPSQTARQRVTAKR